MSQSLPSFLKTTLTACALTISLSAYAQEAEDESGKQDEVERITVEGQSGDAAMKAFNSGDFALAELEFNKNAKCALRKERNRQAFIEGVQDSQLNSALRGDSVGAENTSNPDATGSTGSAEVDTNVPFKSSSNNNRKKKPTLRDRTCDNRGFQIYMAGMSQIQLGRPKEALENFERAVRINRNLYDAHYRIGLMKLLFKDPDGAQDELSAMKTILERCYKCDAKEEIIARVDHLEKALGGKVKLH